MACFQTQEYRSARKWCRLHSFCVLFTLGVTTQLWFLAAHYATAGPLTRNGGNAAFGEAMNKSKVFIMSRRRNSLVRRAKAENVPTLRGPTQKPALTPKKRQQTFVSSYSPRVILLFEYEDSHQFHSTELRALPSMNDLSWEASLGFNGTVEPMGGPCPSCIVNETAALLRESNATLRYNEYCEPMAEWQNTHYPTCNNLHELEIDRANESNIFLMSDNGFFRSAWSVEGAEDDQRTVLKMLQIDESLGFDDHTFGLHRIDAAVMERMTSSPFIVDVYSFCGQSVVTEFCVSAKYEVITNENATFTERLQASIDITQGLLALHSIDYPNATKPSFVHMDLKPHNVMQTIKRPGTRSRLKLNDFNLGLALRQDPATKETCAYPIKNRYGGAPELHYPNRTHDTTVDAHLFEMFRMGHLLYAMATRRPHTSSSRGEALDTWIVDYYLYEKEEVEDEAGNAYLDVKNPEILSKAALLYAVLACTQADPRHRPNTHELLLRLREAQRRILLHERYGTTGETVTTVEQLKALFEIHAPIL